MDLVGESERLRFLNALFAPRLPAFVVDGPSVKQAPVNLWMVSVYPAAGNGFGMEEVIEGDGLRTSLTWRLVGSRPILDRDSIFSHSIPRLHFGSFLLLSCPSGRP